MIKNVQVSIKKQLKFRNTVSYQSNEPSQEEETEVPPSMLRVREPKKFRELNWFKNK